MSTVTSYLNLVKAAIGEQYSLTTTNNNLDSIDDHLKNVVQKMARGRLAWKSNDSANTGLNATLAISDYVTVSLISGRYYTATYRFNTVVPSTASVGIAFTLRKSATSDVGSGGTDVDDAITEWSAPFANSGRTHILQVRWKATATETVNIKFVTQRITGSGITYDISLRRLSVEDAGNQF